MKRTAFKLVVLSNNTNSFGLRSCIILAQDGMAWEIAINQLSVDYLKLNGNEVVLGVDDNGDLHSSPVFTFELPKRLENAKPSAVEEIWGVPEVK